VRLPIAIGVVALALAGALYIHERRVTVREYATHPAECVDHSGAYLNLTYGETAWQCRFFAKVNPSEGAHWVTASRYVNSTLETKPSWQDPVALGVAIGAVAVAVAILRL
jgi:hypothetical protein